MLNTNKVRVQVRAHARSDLEITVKVGGPSNDVPVRPAPLAVKLPDLPSVPEVWRGATYVVRRLLGPGDANPKLRRSNRAGTPYRTWGLALAPARDSGHQLCSSSSPACRRACLYHQGHARLDPAIAVCRIAKTLAWKTRPDWFKPQLLRELGAVARRAADRGFRVAVRLNLTSDVMWEREFADVFARFPDFRYYDYSKHVHRIMRFVRGGLPPSYHLTFSRSEANEARCREVLSAGGNVAVVFRDRHFLAFAEIDLLDIPCDVRANINPTSAGGVVVGLSAKRTARDDRSGLVVDADRPRRRFPLTVV